MNYTDELIKLGLLDEPTNGISKPAAFVPPTPSSQDFVPPVWFPRLSYFMATGKGVSLFGPRGSGKSTAIRKYAESVGASLVTLQCAANGQIDSLIGVWTVVNGATVLEEGPLAVAYRDHNPNGSILAAEESNAYNPAVWSVVNTLTDNTKEGLRLPTGEVIPYNPYFRLVLLYNEGSQYSGTRDPNAALKDRLAPIYCGYPDRATESRILAGMTAAAPSDVDRVIEVAGLVRQAIPHFDLSVRPLARWINMVAAGVCTWAEGFEYCVIDLLGAPEVALAGRALLAEVANNSVANWN